MASRILLISTNKCDFPYPVFPLGLAHVANALSRAGHEIQWHDCQFQERPLGEVLREFRPDYVALSLRNIDDVVFKRRETYFGALITLSREVRRHCAAPLILGGSGFSIFPRRLIELAEADFGIEGEGEASVVELIEALESGGSCYRIPGLVYREDGRVRVNPRSLGSLEALPEPIDRPSELVAYYLRASSMLNVQTQRGCAFECCYCTYPLLEGRARRRRDPEAIAEEFVRLQALGARYLYVVDSVFNSTPAHVIETCEAIVRRGVKVPWGCFLRPQGLTAEQMKLMARAGLSHIEFGSDSFSDSVLEAYGKHFRFEDARFASELAEAEKVDYCHFLICGGPGETPETMRETYRNAGTLANAVILALPGMRIYPGTPLFEQARREELVTDDDDLLEPRFYFSPALGAQEAQRQLAEFAGKSPNWIVNEPNEAYYRMASRLRERGVVGPLWSYLSLLQRVMPGVAPASGGSGSGSSESSAAFAARATVPAKRRA